MHFGLLQLVLLLFTVANRSLARKIRVDRLPNGIDHFEALDDDKESICTTTDKATEFCAKHGAISVRNIRACPGHEASLHCRCNSTKSTFLLHVERCVKEENVSRYLQGGTYPACKHYLAIRDGGYYRSCTMDPVPTLLTNTTDTRHYSVCITHASQDVTSCKPDVSNALYFNKGRWRRMWRLDPKDKSVSEPSLETLLAKLSANTSRWSGFMVSLQATCLVKSDIGLILRGQGPAEQVQACLLLKISGSHSWTLKSHQMNFTQSIKVNSGLTLNKTNHERDHNKTDSKKNNTEIKSTTTTIVTPVTDQVETIDQFNTSSSWQWPSGVLGAFYGVLVFLIIIIACWLFREEYRNRRKLKRKFRNRTHRRRSIGNPTYERGVDTTLTPLTAVNHSDLSPYAVFRGAHAYQPIVANTRPHSVDCCNNFYESIKSVRGEAPQPPMVSYAMYQDLNRTNTYLLPIEPENYPCAASNNFNSTAAANSNEEQENGSTPPQTKQRPRSKSEVLSKEIRLVNIPALNHSPVTNGGICGTVDSNEQCDFNPKRRGSEALDGEEHPLDEARVGELTPLDGTRMGELTHLRETRLGELTPRDKTRVGELTDICQSNSSPSLQKDSSSSPSFPVKYDNEVFCENEQTSDSSKEAQRQSKTVGAIGSISSKCGTARDGLHDGSSERRLSGLEIVDSDYSEWEETDNQSDRFYYVLEGPNPTSTL